MFWTTVGGWILDIHAYIAILHFLPWSSCRFLKAESNWASRDIWFSGKVKAYYWAYKLYQGEYIICKDLTVYCQWVARCQPMGLLTEKWYRNSPLRINPWLRKLRPVNILICFLGRPRCVAALRRALRVDRKRLYMYKKVHLGGF